MNERQQIAYFQLILPSKVNQTQLNYKSKGPTFNTTSEIVSANFVKIHSIFHLGILTLIIFIYT